MPNIVIPNTSDRLPRSLYFEGRRNVGIVIAKEVGGICSGDLLAFTLLSSVFSDIRSICPRRVHFCQNSVFAVVPCGVRSRFSENLWLRGEGRTASMGSPVYHKPLWTILHAVRRSTPCALYGNLVRVQFLCLILYSRFVHFILL